MAGIICADTLQDGAGNSTAMDNAIYGSAKAWVDFVGSSGSINSSYNVSSVTRISTGQYTVNFTNAFVDTKYLLTSGTDYQAGTTSIGLVFLNANGTNGSKTTSACGISCYNSGFSFFDSQIIYCVFFR